MGGNQRSLLRRVVSTGVGVIGAVVWTGLASVSGGEEIGGAAQTNPHGLPLVTTLPAGYGSIGELAGRGEFYAAEARAAAREDDGNHYHGYDGPLVWAEEPDGVSSQGVVYGVEHGLVVSAGYLVRQADLAAGKSFHGLTLRELDVPAARFMTVDLIAGETAGDNLYLWLWHFRPTEGADGPVLARGELPPASSLPSGYEVFACDHLPETRFCPGMGRHFVDLPDPPASLTVGRTPDATGDEGVIYGEAADTLIFIEYVFTQQDLIAGLSWPAIPLVGLPIPPIDNVHILHFGTDDSQAGRYTVHMYFIPEDVYLAWEVEPDALSPSVVG